MSGASGLFGGAEAGRCRGALCGFIDGMRLFGRGYSWGGFESLLIPAATRAGR